MTIPAALLLALAVSNQPAEIESLALLDFREASAVAAWRPVHDSVMGGVSRGRATAADGAARFEGQLSLDNNGGFASFRIGSELPDLADWHGLRLRVRGDGQVYKLSLRTDGRWDGVSWQAPFATTAGEWTTVHVPFDQLTPGWRGRLVTGVPPLDGNGIREVGIVIADKQVGPYAIDVASIGAWRAVGEVDGQRLPEGSRGAAQQRSRDLAAMVDRGSDLGDLLESMRWNERVLVVAAPRQLGPDASIQIGRFLAVGEDLAARELRVVHLMGNGAARLAGRTLGGEATAALREQWQLPAGDWTVALVGKDGGVKARWSEPVEPAEVFDLIDAMPMRADEVRERRAD